MGKIVIILGIFLIVLGLLIEFYPRVPFIGKLPGDFYIKQENFSFYFPLATSIILSVILSLAIYILSKFR
ncbi:MAG: DUF2905 domain-containing protein [Thermodesulfobacteriota bacterium]